MKFTLKDRKKIILIIALCIFAVSLIYRITHPYKQKRVAKLTYTGQQIQLPGEDQTPQNKEASMEEHMVKLDLFLNPPNHVKEVSSNIFSDQKTIPEATEHIDVETPEDDLPEQITQTAQDTREQVENDLSKFKSFGYLEINGTRTLFLERGKQILVIQKGDRIDGKYIVKDITEKELTLTAQSINEDIHIDLSEL
jgi:hypothetical protein